MRQRKLNRVNSNVGFKSDYCDRFETGISRTALKGMTRLSRRLDDILNQVPIRQASYVGASAFAHKSGLHANAILKIHQPMSTLIQNWLGMSE